MNDLDRLRREYADRRNRLAHKTIYSYTNTSYLYSQQQLERSLLATLQKNNFSKLTNKHILEVGCGSGNMLVNFLRYGASPTHIFGIDLLFDRLVEAKSKLNGSFFANADGQYLALRSRSMDIILQSTAFSSILDDTIKTNIAAEMLRLLKPGGLILWYDFWLNPTNPQTKGIRPKEICALFPGCTYDFRRITLAPPLARRIAPWGWGLALFLESLRVFNSHYLVAIRPVQDG